MSQSIPLWAGDASGPTLTPQIAKAATSHVAVMVCPGGGYGGLADHEGPVIADAFNAAGFHASVLRYRVAPHQHPSMIHDALRGMRMMRANAATYFPDHTPTHFAVLGFSAGGHLVSTVATGYDRFPCDADDLSVTVNARPDAVVLCYAVVDFEGEHTHEGSRRNLLGARASDPAWRAQLNAVNHVTPDSPPAFLWHTVADQAVPVENSILYAQACRRNKVPFAMHIFPEGQHGVGLATDMPDVAEWFKHCCLFLNHHVPRTEVS